MNRVPPGDKEMARIMKLAVFTLVALIATVAWSQSADTSPPFAPLDRWKNAVIAGDTEALKMLFSTTPVPKVSVGKEASDAATEAGFWKGLKASQITLDIVHN